MYKCLFKGILCFKIKMGNASTSLKSIAVKKKLTQQDISNLCIEFNKFQETHCEFSEEYYMSFNELLAAFWSYSCEIKNMRLFDINPIIKDIVKLLYPKLKLSGFLMTDDTEYNYAYVVGMRLKYFPLLPEVNDEVVVL